MYVWQINGTVDLTDNRLVDPVYCTSILTNEKLIFRDTLYTCAKCVCGPTLRCVCVLSFCLCICPCVYVAQAPVPRGYWFHTLDCVTQIEKIGTLSCSGFNLSGFNCLLIMLQLVRRNYQRDLQYFILPLFSTLGPSTPFLGNILLNVSSS